MGKASVALLLIGGALHLIALMVLFRMTIKLNSVLPPRKRIQVFEFRNHISEIRRVYEGSFPEGALSNAWLMLTVGGVLACAAAVVVELFRTSKHL
jgi:hypothetical protein